MSCRQCGGIFVIGTDGLCDQCRKLRVAPDRLSMRTHLGKAKFDDMKQLDEPDRIKVFVGYLIDNPGKEIALMVDVGPGYEGKGDRYIKAIQESLPKAKLVRRMRRMPGPLSSVEVITFKL